MTSAATVEAISAGAEHCWVCHGSATEVVRPRTIDGALTPDDLRITDHRYGQTLTLRKCAACGFVFAQGAEVSELVGVYERLEDSGYEETQDTRALQMEWVLRKCAAARPEARTLLDIGAGAGLLVSKARKRGLDAVGVEPSRSLVAAAPRVNGVDLIQGIFPHPALAGKKFDLITLVDVIEHVNDPVALLRSCRESLSERGLLLVITPDVGSVLARLMGFRWWHFRLAHVGYFNTRNLTLAANNAGLRVARTLRAKWFFRVRYLADRLGEYLPIRGLNKLADRVPPTRWAYDRVVPLNLHDSILMLLESAPESGR